MNANEQAARDIANGKQMAPQGQTPSATYEQYVAAYNKLKDQK